MCFTLTHTNPEENMQIDVHMQIEEDALCTFIWLLILSNK